MRQHSNENSQKWHMSKTIFFYAIVFYDETQNHFDLSAPLIASDAAAALMIDAL